MVIFFEELLKSESKKYLYLQVLLEYSLIP